MRLWTIFLDNFEYADSADHFLGISKYVELIFREVYT